MTPTGSNEAHIACAKNMQTGDWEREKAELLAKIDEDATAVHKLITGVHARDLDGVLDEVAAFIDRFMALPSREHLDAITLWAAHTHATEHFDVVAYLFVTSAEKRSGKSLLLDLLERLVCRGRSTMNISSAALYRMIDEQHPTLLFDEVDNIFTKGNKVDPAKADLVGLINAGFRKGRSAFRMGGPNMRTLEEFDPFGPKALAGIGACLPDPTMDRCIPIKLPRKGRSVSKERYRIRVHELETERVGTRLALAVADASAHLANAWPDLPAELSDRAQDIWEPLLAIADAAGGDWPTRARVAARRLHADADDDTESVRTKLLADIRIVFTTERMLTKNLVEKLNELDESPWPDWRGGNGISSRVVVDMLRDYGIKSKQLRDGDARGRGFERWQFDDAFDRYLRHPNGDDVDSDDSAENPQVGGVNETGGSIVDASVDGPDQGKHAVVNGVNTDNGHHTEGAIDEDLYSAYLEDNNA